jgi:hypothetical protein
MTGSTNTSTRRARTWCGRIEEAAIGTRTKPPNAPFRLVDDRTMTETPDRNDYFML